MEPKWYMLFCLLVICGGLPVIATDPCEAGNHVVRRDEWQRSVGHVKQSGDIAICDRYIDEGWYRFISPAGNDMPTTCPNFPNRCGTTWPIWLDGNLPATNTEIQATACLYSIFDCCEKSYDIKVKNCNDEFNVYYLVKTTGCSEAYCVGTETPCPDDQSSPTGFTPGCTGDFPRITIVPTLDWTIGTRTRNGLQFNEIQFRCHPDFSEIAADKQADLVFDVNWYMDEDLVHTHQVPLADLPAILQESDWEDEKRLNVKVSCEVRARFGQNGAVGTKLRSQTFYAGIEVVTDTPLHVSEGDLDATLLEIRPTLPVLCTPFPDFDLNCNEKYLIVEVKIPNVPDRTGQCKGVPVSTTRELVKELEGMPCGVQIPVTTSMDDWNQATTYPLHVKAVLDGKYDGDHIAAVKLGTANDFFWHPIWTNYLHPDILVHVIDEDAELAGVHCYSHNDPHMLSFSGIHYECQLPGEFILYRHKTLPIQVNTFFTKCGGATCNCGVAVKSGGDVFVVDSCDQTGRDVYFKGNHRSRLRMGMIGCDEETMRVERLVGIGYKVYLPTGGYVLISLHDYGEIYLANVDIYAGTLDYANTEGLCGDFTGPRRGNLRRRDGVFHNLNTENPPNTFSESWKIPMGSSESLYNGDGSTRYARHPYCSCENEGDTFDPESRLSCGFNQKVSDCIDSIKDITRQQYQNCRRRRDLSGTDRIMETRIFVEDSPPNETATWTNGWTEDVARAYCSDEILGGALGNTSAALSNLKPENYVEECVLDIKITGDTHFTKATKEAFRMSMEVELEKNSTLWIFDNETGRAFLPESIAAGLCPNQCSGNGICSKSNGTCSCEDGYYGADCSMDKNVQITCFEMPDNGLCDESSRPCRETPVYCSMFIQDLRIKCMFTVYKVTFSGVTTTSSQTESDAEFVHIQEVMCSLPNAHSRKKRTISPGSTEVVLAEGYKVSVSNNGLNYSEPRYILVYDSKCVDCNSTTNCTLKNGTCIIDGVCYSSGEVNPSNACQTCDPTHNVSGWLTQGSSCVIDGECYTNGAQRAGAACEVCDVNTNSYQWTLQSDKCKVNGTCYETCERDSENSSLICHPDTNSLAWTSVEDAGSCALFESKSTGDLSSSSTHAYGSSTVQDRGTSTTSTSIIFLSTQPSSLTTASEANSQLFSTRYTPGEASSTNSPEDYSSTVLTSSEWSSTMSFDSTSITIAAQFSSNAPVAYASISTVSSVLSSTNEPETHSYKSTTSVTASSLIVQVASVGTSAASAGSSSTSLPVTHASTATTVQEVSSTIPLPEAHSSNPVGSVLPEKSTHLPMTHGSVSTSIFAETSRNLPVTRVSATETAISPSSSLSLLDAHESTATIELSSNRMHMGPGSSVTSFTSTETVTPSSVPVSYTPPVTAPTSSPTGTTKGLRPPTNAGQLSSSTLVVIGVMVALSVVCVCVIIGAYIYIVKIKRGKSARYYAPSSSVGGKGEMGENRPVSVNSNTLNVHVGDSLADMKPLHYSQIFESREITETSNSDSRPMSGRSHHSAWDAPPNEETRNNGSLAYSMEPVTEFHVIPDPVTTALPPLSFRPKFPTSGPGRNQFPNY
ncbi:von Willebrand factor D and EGF domain-containing protein [Lingula anatina]|uniref:von Willebrand factor D and EGF domain-containing protein n=1 Tax=Lingula anatina TaxID=7574 RepID=A0A1S3HI20_LINAN|nr:von Willebrand factor D and EGF domain-containing protein [Lingula anatina]|eukprot:XP_013385755.1 von Willebrand factor D and EGF domain-containing protein [Lingula anatina]